MFSEIKDEYNLDCTEEQFNEFMENHIASAEPIAIELIKHTFDEPYNGIPIENIFNDEHARYYVLSIEGGNTYLQYHVPYVGGIEMITDDNFAEVSASHREQLTEQLIQSRAFNEAITYFQSK